MELLIALALIVAVSELKEWRASKKHQELVDSLTFAQEQINIVNYEGKNRTEHLLVAKQQLAEQGAKIASILERIEDMRSIVDKTESATATILREYEINGVPLGYQRKQPDFIETI